MLELDFLTKEQCFGENQLDIFKKIGPTAAVSDFSILLGCCPARIYYIGNPVVIDYVQKKENLKNRTGSYYTKTISHSEYSPNSIYLVEESGKDNYISYTNRRIYGARPILAFSSITDISQNKCQKNNKNILEIDYGYYPQQAPPKNIQIELEKNFISGNIESTGNTYTTDSKKDRDYNEGFSPIKHIEYKYKEKNYIRVKANYQFSTDYYRTLSNGEIYRDGDFVWVEVQPIKWLVDEKACLMIAKKIVFAGVQFNKVKNYQTSDFDKTDIKRFMNECFYKEILQNIPQLNTNITNQEESIPNKLVATDNQEENIPNKPVFKEYDSNTVINSNIAINSNNITITLPKNIIETISSITLMSQDDNQNQVTYVKKLKKD